MSREKKAFHAGSVGGAGAEGDRQLDALDRELQRVGTWTVLFKQALAERLGISASDLECLDLLAETGPVTAGGLAEHTGLTTAAATGIIDRLIQLTWTIRLQSEREGKVHQFRESDLL